MDDGPAGHALLLLACEAMDDILPQLDGSARSTVRMAMSAIAIAARDLASQCDPDDETSQPVLQGFRLLYGDRVVESIDGDTRTRSDTLHRKLAADLKSGRFDDDLTGSVSDVLREGIIQRLERSNPRFAVDAIYSQPGER